MAEPEEITIDLTPSWPAQLEMCLALLDAGDATARDTARAELRRMARVADLAVAQVGARAMVCTCGAPGACCGCCAGFPAFRLPDDAGELDDDEAEE